MSAQVSSNSALDIIGQLQACEIDQFRHGASMPCTLCSPGILMQLALNPHGLIFIGLFLVRWDEHGPI